MNICAVIVSYHPEPAIIQNVDSLRPQVSDVVVVDNGSGPNSVRLLNRLEANGIHVIRNQTNLGIAAALNLGIRQAMALGYRWIATFDQDSTVARDFFQNMLLALQSCPSSDQVALISPVHHEPDAQSALPRKADLSQSYSFIADAWTSGSLIKAEAFERIGWYDESLFIDYVDFDFCLRLRRTGFKLMRSQHSFLTHRLGSPETHSVLGLRFTLKSHNALRHYYMMRNRVIVIRRHALAFPGWALKELRWMVIDPFKVLFFEKDRRAKLRCMMKGFRHGLTCSSKIGSQLPAVGDSALKQKGV